MSVTTVKKGFKVEDITFRDARRQSAILDEIKAENPDIVEDDDIKAPVSITPEQVTNFYMQKIEKASDSNEKRVYSQTITWIKELQDLKKEYNLLEAKLHVDEKEEYDNEIVDED